jgi:hypothetical protein
MQHAPNTALLRFGFAVVGLFVLVLNGAAWSDDAPTKETWIDFHSDEQIGGLTHSFWVVFPPQLDQDQAKIKHAYGFNSFDLVLSGKKPVVVSGEKEADELLLYNFVAPQAQGDQLASMTFLFVPKDGTATGFFRLANGQRHTIRGRAR